ncbi:MAG: hypothetical protein A2504_08555 [Bdellovibrionales bacterium RIFOXYD12_FULL_39_22]|nr:MAG: hypothetical protein A2385_01780 [Bdellovibrionales bacterium RIFOXYB1_FULL_39_21]OFZ42826.1 MAG: hypothetical protein A2485_10595 [Bdellovibrionales bacterium RIFOXYC12_FULL_39_17]OFZ47515.1 MAG: hypothetical protein A2404_14700 [Bdellovibrionales bacterium RIFOXYC1_FULL_39_130]OFZ75603.1 MAG: hypothetical protein A2560_14850 [Bdellovibrionales bacterium RIFOXYD1_FULL_39_84]OFZ93926.1 MAG: hypothetical protein A2504_08555 [Bdellovibrionales bacterium RIFOXYD12_FULL_39_22]HLE10068.1 Ft
MILWPPTYNGWPAVTNIFKAFVAILFQDRSSLRFAIGVAIGISFSMAVILATIGIMDGFDESLKVNLKKSLGDIAINYRDGFLYTDGTFAKQLQKDEKERIGPLSFMLRVEGFIIGKGVARGVQISGIDPAIHSDIVGLNLNFAADEVAIGMELAHDLELAVGDEVVLAMSHGNDSIKTLPVLNNFRIGQIVNHGIYLKDSRAIYLQLSRVQEILQLFDKANIVTFNINSKIRFENAVGEYVKAVSSEIEHIREFLGIDYSIRPFWHEYAGLLEAVEVEKVMIGLVLQVVVVVSMFNMLAFLIYVNEKYVKEIFLLRALGLTKRRLTGMWMQLVFLFWMVSVLISYLFVKLINLILQNLDFFQVPGEIYNLARFKIILASSDYLAVYGGALIWVIAISGITLYRLYRVSLLHGLRKEFA